jgi:hypothetical protein
VWISSGLDERADRRLKRRRRHEAIADDGDLRAVATRDQNVRLVRHSPHDR